MSRRSLILTIPAAPVILGLAACGHAKVTTSSQPAPLGTTSATAAGPLKAGTYAGQIVNTRYGPVQIAVTVSSGKITGVSFLALPHDRARSQSISSQAAPLLRSEALQAQSANVNLLSGATYTSDGFAQSLQSALAGAR